MVLTLVQTETEQVAAEIMAESYNAVMKDKEMKLVAAPANIDVHPDPALATATRDLSVYARIFMGFVGVLVLLTPLMLLPGFIVLVLPAEIYAVGWVYDHILKLRESGIRTTDSSLTGTVTLEAERDRMTMSTLHYPDGRIEVLQ